MNAQSPKRKILVIEDDDFLREIITEKLYTNGYEAVSADDGINGLAMARSFRPDLILIDILMPRMNGYEAIEEIRKDADLKDTPIIVISNSGQPIELARMSALGVKDYIVKANFTPEDVLQKVHALFSNSFSSDPLSEREGDSSEHRSRKRILIIEDDPFLQDLLARKIGSKYDAYYAKDGEAGVSYIEKNDKPDAVLLDILLPGMSGFDVLKKIRVSCRGIPIIMISNLGQQSDIDKAKELGADDFIVKVNYTIGEIIARMEDHIKKSANASA